jgi:hypothetical protein
MLHTAKWHVHCCYVYAPCDLARQFATSISSRFWPSAQLLRGLVVSLSAAYFLAAMPSRKCKLSATASSASSNATGARSEASSANRAHLGSREELLQAARRSTKCNLDNRKQGRRSWQQKGNGILLDEAIKLAEKEYKDVIAKHEVAKVKVKRLGMVSVVHKGC